MKKLLSIALAMVMILAVLAGCSAPADDAPDATEGGAAGGEAKTTLVSAINNDPDTLNPLESTKVTEYNVWTQICEPLYRVENGETVYILADSVEISEDGLTYTIQVKQGVTFQNGEVFDAQDVVFTLQQAVESPYVQDKVAGLTTDGIVATGDYTVELRLEEPNAALFAALPNIYMVPNEYYAEVGAQAFGTAPVGTGPYSFVSYTPGQEIVLKAYEGYYGEAPTITDVTFRIISDNNTILLGLQSGEIDIAELSTDNYNAAKADSNLVCDLSETSATMYVYINTEREPYDDPLVRQAIAYAVDRQYMVTLGASGLGAPTSYVGTASMVGYPTDVTAIETDVEKAKELLAQAGYPNGFDGGTITTAAQYENVAVVLQEQLAQIGITLEINTPDGNTFVSDSAAGNYDLGMVALSLGSDMSAISFLYSTDMIDVYNFARYSDPEVDQWLADALVETDTAARTEIYAKILNKMQEEMPYVAVYNKQALIVRNPDLVPDYYPSSSGSGDFVNIAGTTWKS